MKTIKTTVAVAVLTVTICACTPCMDGVEEERIMGMSYHDNAVTIKTISDGKGNLTVAFSYDHTATWTITGGVFTLTGFDVTSGQDPNHYLTIGNNYPLNSKSEFVFAVGRKASKEVAASFNSACPPARNTFGHTAGELNFWMKGTMSLNFKNGKTYTFPNTFFAQGHTGAVNNWWFGNDAMRNSSIDITLFDPYKSKYVTYYAINNSDLGYISPIEDPNLVFQFLRGVNGIDLSDNHSTVKLIGVYYIIP